MRTLASFADRFTRTQANLVAARAAQKYMVQQQYGKMVFISSTSALGNRGQANYSTAKAGLQGLTRTLSIELGRLCLFLRCQPRDLYPQAVIDAIAAAAEDQPALAITR